ncbi:hypothetical protein A5819_001976 [Enterococcus sp. 7E2_DIV0204]|uniref:glycosyltransferase family 1 protein n=1 Tax=unclassified Enterococcus TaxID=2608891 RepID=UPI000A33137A|nr:MULTISPECIES: glycosyltransferase family 1 protein [unclassified Enterococcus]OTN89484.1 hypothetical protein A5819_001976 [Enterococcus sp. 7E2_DIV0204]OTP51938.1 hypothetical protein A5884_001133 [Enterococcus sp. 7D2_DIV0200]
MDNKKKEIRIAMIMGKMIGGGIEAVVMNYYRQIDHSKIQFDFIIDSDSTIVPKEEIIQLGGRIFEVSPYQSIRSYNKDLETLFNKEDYQIVHSHLNSLSIFPLRVAKKCGVPIRIAHNHSTAAPGETKKNIMKYILRFFSTIYPTHYAAPTLYAGRWLFGEKVANTRLEIIKNAIDLEKFVYNPVVRSTLRHELGFAKDDFVIGNIGRFVWQKNQAFIVELFNEVLKKKENAKLILIGEGPLKLELEKKVLAYGIKDKVTFLSNTDNIHNYYQIMDIFLFPSNYEGLGMVAVEAQISGLPVITSTKVPIDAKISNRFYQIDLKKHKEQWLECLLTLPVEERMRNISEANNNGYNIYIEASKLLNYYVALLKNKEKKWQKN